MNTAVFGVFGPRDAFEQVTAPEQYDRVLQGRAVTVGVSDVALGLPGRTQVHDGEDGIRVGEVVSESPADEAGIRAGDVILTLRGERFADASELVRFVTGRKPGDVLPTRILRDGEEVLLSVTLARRPSDAEREETARPSDAIAVSLDGASIHEIADALARYSGEQILVLEAEKISGTVTYRSPAVDLEEMLDFICDALGCTWEKRDSGYVLRPR